MAKYEKRLRGNFSELLSIIENGIFKGSVSASIEDGSDYSENGVRCAVRVFERYSMFGGNRVSLNVTMLGSGDDLFVSAITSGGSKAVFFKINTLGEESFLSRFAELVEGYRYTPS